MAVLPPSEAPPKSKVDFIDRLEDEAVKDPNRRAWETNRQRSLDLYTGNHFADVLDTGNYDSGRQPEERSRRTVASVVRITYNRVMNAVLAHLAGQVGNSPKIVFNARESGEPPIYYLNGYVQNPIVQQMAMQMGMSDPRVQELHQIYGNVAGPNESQGILPGGGVSNGRAMATGQPAPGVSSDETVPAGAEILAGAQEQGNFNRESQPDDSGLYGGNAGASNAGATVLQPATQPHPETANAATQVGLSIPLQEPFISQMKAAIDAGKRLTMAARMQGLPPPLNVLPPEALVEVTDQSKAQLRQTVFDALWEQCGGVECCNENILNKKILGWQPTLVESDRTKIDIGDSPITLTNVEGAQVYYDPMTSSYRPPRYAIMREPVSVEEGIAKYSDPVKYPGVADTLRRKAEAGTLGNRLSRNGVQSRLSAIDFGRDMCVIRTVWYRDWPYPMDPDEAMEKGKVQIGQVPDEQANQWQSLPGDRGARADQGALLAPERSGGDVPADAAQSANPELGSGLGNNGDGGTAEQQPVPPVNPPVQLRSAFLHSDTGEEVTPGGPNWPIVYAIREIRDIEGEVVFDQRCRCPDIPLPNNINIPVPFSPYGIGEPDRLDGLQMAINRILSDLVNFHRYNAYPPELMDSVVNDRLAPQLRKQRSKPNDLIVVPHDITQMVGGDLSKLVTFMELPTMGPDAWKLLEFLVDAIDKEAGNTETTQGIAPSGSSGAWVANLQAAASQVMQVTSMSTEAWLRKIVQQILYFIDHSMTVEDIQKYTSKYPPPILAALHSPQKSPYIDISVEIQSGSAAAKQGQTASMIQAKQAGLPVSAPSIMERMNLDRSDELKRQGDFNQKMIETGAVEMMPQPTGQEQGQPPQSNAA